VFHIQHQCETLANLLGRLAQGAATRRQRLEQRMAKARLKGQGNTLSSKLAKARKTETHALKLAKDIKTLVGWLERDILALAGLCFEARCELFNFIVTELEHREHLDSARIRPVRIALARQRDNLLGFAKVLDNKLEEIAQRFQVPDYQVRALCLLQRKPKTSQAYWMGRDQLNQQLAWKFHAVWGALVNAMAETHRSSSLVENLNGRLRNYFFLRRNLGQGYLDLLRFFLNHRVFMRSERPERVGKSPAELLTGKPHPHWLELLGFERFRQAPIPA
jgi:cell division protein ZapA (FtsZ GTPase activity inhibitor)